MVDYSPDISPDGSRIAYATTRHRVPEEGDRWRNFEIETSGLDGSDSRRRLTDYDGQDVSPEWSPDGNRIAFVRKVSGIHDDARGIYTMAADGSDTRRVHRFRDARDQDGPIWDRAPFTGPTWSPDGETLAVVLTEDKRVGVSSLATRTILYTIGADGSDAHRVFTTPDSETSFQRHRIVGAPAWSPDGRKLAFLVVHFIRRTPRLTVHTIDREGSGMRELGEVEPIFVSEDPSLSWSPDGTTLLFSWGYFTRRLPSDKYGFAPAIYTVASDGANLRAVAHGTHASWSPDGSRIATTNVYYDPDKARYLSTVASDGTDLRILVRRDGDGLKAESPRSRWSWLPFLG